MNMDEYDQKILTANIFIQTQAAGALYSKILSTKKDGNKSDQTPEIAALYLSVRRGEAGEVGAALSGLLALLNNDIITPIKLLSNLLADVLSAKVPAPIVQAISQVMLIMSEKDWRKRKDTNDLITTSASEKIEPEASGCLTNPFSGPPSGPVSPFVTLVRKKIDLAPLVLEECSYLLNHPDKRVQDISVSMVQPLLLYSSCLIETSSCALLLSPLLQLLREAFRSTRNSDIVSALLTAAQLTRSCSSAQLEAKMSVLCTIASIALDSHNDALQHCILPALICTLGPATEGGLSTRTLMRHIVAIVPRIEGGCDVSVGALALALPRVTTANLVTLLKCCGQLVSSSCSNPLVCCTLLSSVLQILSAPCSTVPALTSAASALAALVQHKQVTPSDLNITGNPYWSQVVRIFPSLPSLVTMVEVCNQLVVDPELSDRWLKTLAQPPTKLNTVHRLMVTAVFLYQGSPPRAVVEAARALEREVVSTRSGELELFPQLLYRLARDRDPDTRLTLLHLMPSLASNKMCVSLILKTLFSLWLSAPLRPVILRVTYDLWRVEPRVYAHLLKLIADAEQKAKQGGKWDGDLCVARAFVMAQICKDTPSQHGEELLPMLSNILNDNSSKSSVVYSSGISSNSSDPSHSLLVSTCVCCFTLDGITELIRGGVIDLRTTWRVLAPQLSKDKRPEVIAALCRMLSLAAKLQVKSDEFTAFCTNTLNILWSWTSHQNKTVVREAYLALEEFNMASFVLKMLPAHARHGIKLPDSLAATPFEAARRPEDVLTYVPGEAWISLVRGAKVSHMPYLESFVQSLIRREVAGLFKGMYLTAIQEAKRRGLKGSGGQHEPLCYDFMKEYSTLKATVAFLRSIPKDLAACGTKDEGEKLLNTLLIFLKALGQPLNRPYPALDWILLSAVQEAVNEWCQKHAKVDWDEQIRHSVFGILAKQCNKSASASTLISKYLVPSASNGLTQKDEIKLFGLMDYLGRGIPPSTLQPFITFTLNRYIGDEHQLNLLLDAVRPVLTSEFIHDTNRNALGNAIENLNDKIDPTNSALYNSYKACVADLPSKHIERLTSPSLWWEVTDERLYRAAVLRCHVAVKDQEEMALQWLNDIVDCAASLPGDRSALLKEIARALTLRYSDQESSSWFLQLLGQLLEQTKKKVPDNLVANHEHNQRILFYSDLIIISLIVWSGNYIHCGIDKIIDEPALRHQLLVSSIVSLNERSHWDQTLPQLLNFLVSSYHYLKQFLAAKKELVDSTLVIANICSALSQQMWNKVVTLCVEVSS
ncbi:focadhesin-like [Hyalella azteca]|uniref:Focadhesin-like n=1 Tax=Hyalella azteca TaxID=294128 RepID=A0A8B7MYQ5_HYAAZ|nr:focadhesin-like [Hyalella azteca]